MRFHGLDAALPGPRRRAYPGLYAVARGARCCGKGVRIAMFQLPNTYVRTQRVTPATGVAVTIGAEAGRGTSPVDRWPDDPNPCGDMP